MTNSYTVYPADGSPIQTFTDYDQAFAYASQCGHNSSIWNNLEDWEQSRIW